MSRTVKFANSTIEALGEDSSNNISGLLGDSNAHD